MAAARWGVIGLGLLLLAGCSSGTWRVSVPAVDVTLEEIVAETPTATITPIPIPSDTPTMTPAPTFTPTMTPTPAATTAMLTIYAEPDTLTLSAGEEALVGITLDTGGRPVDTVDTFLAFDALVLEAVEVTAQNTDLLPTLLSEIWNSEGVVIYSAGTLTGEARWVVRLAVVRFKALVNVTGEPVHFLRQKPLRWTSAWYDGLEWLP